MAKHRAIPPMSFSTLLILAVAGAVASAVLIYLFNPTGKRPVAQVEAAPSVAVSSGVPATSAPSLPVSAAPTSPSPSPAPVRPASSAPGRPVPSKTPSPSASSVVTARYVVTSQWDTGFVVAFDVSNPGTRPATWIVEVTYTANVVITSENVWNATVERAGNVYRFRANSGTALAAGQSAQFGYMAGAPSGASRPSRCTVNGRTCE